jgi:hypothetical protein
MNRQDAMDAKIGLTGSSQERCSDCLGFLIQDLHGALGACEENH